MLITIGIIAIALVLVVVAFVATYTVVDPNEAHIVVVGSTGRKVYTPHVEVKDGVEEKSSTAYFFIPFLMRRIVLPLSNIKLEISKYQLRDANMAPFICEATCWFRIERPEIAVEKLDFRSEGAFKESVRDTLEEQVRGVSRAAAMNQEILELMRDRKTFGNRVEEEVNGALQEWGLEIVKLEIVDFNDDIDSSIIADYERMRQAEIDAVSRKKVAEEKRDAEIVEVNTAKEAGVAKALSEQEVDIANVEKDKMVKTNIQEAEKEIATKTEEANRQKVEAERTLTVGNAGVLKEATIVEADGLAEATKKEGFAEAEVTYTKRARDAAGQKEWGLAEAEVIEHKGLSEAVGTDAKAEALKKYEEAGLTIEQLHVFRDIEIAKYQALGKALEKANMNISTVTGGDAGEFFGIKMGPEGGAGLGQMMRAFKTTYGKDVGDIVKGIVDTVKGNKEPEDTEDTEDTE